MIRWGLCCIFREAPIKFRRTTAKYSAKLSNDERMRHLSTICLHNASSLLKALQFCRHNGINAFRINDYIDSEDFPKSWLNLDITVEVEAKAKELAVLKLMREIEKNDYKF